MLFSDAIAVGPDERVSDVFVHYTYAEGAEGVLEGDSFDIGWNLDVPEDAAAVEADLHSPSPSTFVRVERERVIPLIRILRDLGVVTAEDLRSIAAE